MPSPLPLDLSSPSSRTCVITCASSPHTSLKHLLSLPPPVPNLAFTNTHTTTSLTFESSIQHLTMNVLKNGWNSKSNNSSSGGSGGSKWIPTVPGADRIGKHIPTGVVRYLPSDNPLSLVTLDTQTNTSPSPAESTAYSAATPNDLIPKQSSARETTSQHPCPP